MAEYKPVDCKSGMNKFKRTNCYFWALYSCNPYRGCEHSCLYCDAQSEHYNFHDEYFQVVFYKKNIIDVLRKQLRKARKEVISLSTVTDPYQVCEREYRITRQILELCLEYEFPVQIVTKSDLVLDDLDLLEKINKASHCNVLFTITTFNPEYAQLLEPGAPAPALRFEALRRIKARGILTGVLNGPLPPYILDTEENMEDVITRSKAAGADCVMSGGLSLRPGRQKEIFLDLIKTKFPSLTEKYNTLYYGDIGELLRYNNSKQLCFSRLCRRQGVADRLKRYIPADELAANKRIAEVFHNKAYYCSLEQNGAGLAKDYTAIGNYFEDMKTDVNTLLQFFDETALLDGIDARYCSLVLAEIAALH